MNQAKYNNQKFFRDFAKFDKSISPQYDIVIVKFRD